MQRLRQHSKYLLLIIVLAGALFTATHTGARASGASITLSVSSGPPTSYFKVSGTGFGVNEKVIILFDTTQVGTGKTDNTGLFTKSVRVPASALPGNHTIQATGQSSGLTASTTFLVQTNWPMFGFGPEHSHFSRFENVLSPSNVSNLALQWQTSINGQPVFSVPVVVNGVLYVTTSKKLLYAISISSHAVLWTFPLHAGLITSPVVVNGVVYVGNDHLYAINATTGTLIWEKKVSIHIYGLATDNTLLYFDAYYKFCAFTFAGTNVWCDSKINAQWTPTIANGIVYLATNTNALNAYTTSTGKLLWTYPTQSTPLDSPTVVNGILYFGTYDGTLTALNATTGTFLWSYATSAEIQSSPAVANGIVYIGSDYPDNTIYALNAATGVLQWSYSGGSQSFFASPVVANGVVYIGTGDRVSVGTFYAFDASTGAVLFSKNMGTEIFNDAVIVNGIVYVVGEYPITAVYAFGLPG